MNFLNQTKLTKEEWTKMESPIVSEKEQNILTMINNGYQDPESCYVPYPCVRTFLNIKGEFDGFIFQTIFCDKLKKYNKNNVLQIDQCLTLYAKKHQKGEKLISKSDQIKMNNSLRLFEKEKFDDKIMEFVLLREVKALSKIIQKNRNYKTDKKYGLILFNIYTCHRIYKDELNHSFSLVLTQLLENFLKDISSYQILQNISKYVEHNDIFKHTKYELYDHQKDIFKLFKTHPDKPKFVFYCAPTSSGKTLSPLALTNEYKVLFVCASKHIGLSLAKSGYFLKKKIGFAFGCSDVDNIRLNYNAINTYKQVRHRKLPDHSDGTKVEIMICDLVSFECAMLYMKAFHPQEKTILFWDEPTIGLDVKGHMLHEKIKHNWTINSIPNVVFSCATLPKQDKLQSTIQGFLRKFPNSHVDYIESYDHLTNLNVYDMYGNILMPHMYFEDYDKMMPFLDFHGKKYYKFYNCHECVQFILYYDKHIDSTWVSRHFTNMESFDICTIKENYEQCLRSMDSSVWKQCRDAFLEIHPLSTKPHEELGCNLTTNHSASLTNGPTLYICDQVQNICKYLLHMAKMDPTLLSQIQTKIEKNTTISEQLSKKRKDYEDKIEKYKENEKVMENMRFPAPIMELHRQIQALESQIHELHVENVYKPNTRDHFQKWKQDPTLEYDKCDVYTSHVDDGSIQNVMELYTIHALYKILLLMGIGVFSNEIMPCTNASQNMDIGEENNRYVEIMKQLAEQKSLYLIIANSDYIYGTNYQFSHCYLGKDMKHMSQEKIIQCIGRIGRQDKNKHFSFRFRSQEQMDLLYDVPEHSIEAENMGLLFC
tara:strand:- start:11911 stop:14379 length:2469 start_codon:yes stop_codon:yes gene_type:complete